MTAPWRWLFPPRYPFGRPFRHRGWVGCWLGHHKLAESWAVQPGEVRHITLPDGSVRHEMSGTLNLAGPPTDHACLWCGRTWPYQTSPDWLPRETAS